MAVKEIEQTKTKAEIVEILDANDIDYIITACGGCERICISLGNEANDCCNSAITIQTCNKDIRRVYPHEILYIAIEDRKSVLYLTNGRVETNYHLDYWENILDANYFAKPHASYIVNLNYVVEITKDSVKVKHKDVEHSVYTSSRKIGTFKKTFMNFIG